MTLFQTAIEVARYSGGSQRNFSFPSITQSFDTNKPCSTLLSGEKATKETGLEWPSSVCSSVPVTASQSRTVSLSDPDTTCLPSGEKATGVTQTLERLEWPSSVCNSAPVTASQSRTVSSSDPDTTYLPSGEKATEVTQFEWPSSVCRAALHSACNFVFLWIQAGIHPSNCLRTILFSGAKTRAEQYSWRGACSITDRLYKANRLAS